MITSSEVRARPKPSRILWTRFPRTTFGATCSERSYFRANRRRVSVGSIISRDLPECSPFGLPTLSQGRASIALRGAFNCGSTRPSNSPSEIPDLVLPIWMFINFPGIRTYGPCEYRRGEGSTPSTGTRWCSLSLGIGATSTPYCTTFCPPRDATSRGRRCVGRAVSELGDDSTCIGPTIRNGRPSAVNELPTLHRRNGHTDIRYVGTEMLSQ